MMQTLTAGEYSAAFICGICLIDHNEARLIACYLVAIGALLRFTDHRCS